MIVALLAVGKIAEAGNLVNVSWLTIGCLLLADFAIDFMMVVYMAIWAEKAKNWLMRKRIERMAKKLKNL